MSGSESVCVVAKHEKRGRRMKKHSQTLPLELIREILLRLPVRSVLRFKCVCKSWLSLISDPQFGISHYDLAASLTHRLILRSNDYYTESIDVDASLKEYSSCAVHLVLPPPSPPAPPKPWEDYYYADYYNHRETLGSCRGLLLLYYERTCDLILWNPSIGAHKRLPNFFVNEMTCLLYGFGYDTSTDDYLLILIELNESENEESENDECKLEILILSFKDNWLPSKEIHASYKDLGSEFRAGSLLNEALHWFVFSEDKNVPVIIAFDLVQRSLSEIPLIDHLTMENYEAYSLRVMEGCLSVCCFVRGSKRTEIWVMKEYKVQSSWTKFVVIPTCGDYYHDRFSPICITKDGGIFGSNFCGKLEKLNDKGKLLEDLIYDGGQGLYTANKQSSTYRESILSLPSVFWETRDDDHGETSERDPNGETSEDENGETSEDDQQ